MKPNFVGLGAQKCASSWLYQVMSDHPQVFTTEPKELDFFSAFYDRGWQWYERFFEGGEHALARGEVSPSYLPDSDAPARVQAYNPEMKILVCLRDPVARVISNHSHDLRLAFFTGHDGDQSVEQGLANNPMYVEQSLYAKHLQRWLQIFPRERFLFLLQEEIQQDPATEARKVYEFLGVDVEHVSEFNSEQTNASYIPKNRAAEARNRRMGEWLDSVGLKNVADQIRQSQWYDRVKSRNRQSVGDVIPPLLDSTRAELQALFADDMQALAQIMGRDSLPWKSWQAVHG